MNQLEKKMVELLTNLRENYNVIGLKNEFEGEGSRLADFIRLKEIGELSGLGISLKIGGCEAITDMRLAQTVGVKNIVAPMVESPFALKKFVQSFHGVFPPGEGEGVTMAINVESAVGCANFDKMMELPEFVEVTSVNIGSKDLALSMGLGIMDVNDQKVFDACCDIFRKLKKRHPGCRGVLGGVNGKSMPRLLEYEPGMIDSYQTRKVSFRFTGEVGENAKEGLIKAYEFEQLWYECKRARYTKIASEDDKYVQRIQNNLAILRQN